MTRTPQNNGINEPKQYSARAFYILVHFFAVQSHGDLGPAQLASIFHVKQIAIIAKELQKREVIF